MDDGCSPLIRYFKYGHLLPELAEVSKLFYDLAVELDKTLPNNTEKAVALRKLLESKDAAVRSVI